MDKSSEEHFPLQSDSPHQSYHDSTIGIGSINDDTQEIHKDVTIDNKSTQSSTSLIMEFPDNTYTVSDIYPLNFYMEEDSNSRLLNLHYNKSEDSEISNQPENHFSIDSDQLPFDKAQEYFLPGTSESELNQFPSSSLGTYLSDNMTKDGKLQNFHDSQFICNSSSKNEESTHAISTISWQSSINPSQDEKSCPSNIVSDNEMQYPVKTTFRPDIISLDPRKRSLFMTITFYLYIFFPIWFSILLYNNTFLKHLIIDFPQSLKNYISPSHSIWITNKNLPYLEKNGAISSPQFLKDQTKQFKREILAFSSNVYGALGYGLANCYIIKTENGVIIIDTMESPHIMKEIWDDWLTQYYYPSQQSDTLISPKVEAIIYTHFHTDHTFGASAVFEPGLTKVYSHDLTRRFISKTFSILGGATYKRSMRQFGVFVNEDDFINAGIGHHLHYQASSEIGSIFPTDVFTGDNLKINVSGVTLELIHAPGESKDQTIVWYPEQKILFGADNIYRSFPNIYAIRGTETRDCYEWVKSLDKMRFLKAVTLLLGHTRPLIGAEVIYDTLTIYRDAIQFVHDQTLRFINLGYTLNQIIELVHLPSHMENHPFLYQTYGTLPWTIRAIFHQYLGWFSGDSKDLSPLSDDIRASKLSELAGGTQNLLEAAKHSLSNQDYQWALELSSAAQVLWPSSKLTKSLIVASLRGLASQQSSAGGRNWYLTSALEYENKVSLMISPEQKNQVLESVRPSDIFKFLPTRINPKFNFGGEKVIKFTFSDSQQTECLHLRNGMAYSLPYCERLHDTELTCTEKILIQILQKKLNPILAFIKGKISISGSYIKFILALIQIDVNKD